MLKYLLSGGIFMIPIYFSLFFLIFISFKNIKNSYHLDKIILIGSLTAIFGIIATAVGIGNMFSAVPDISKISPYILWNGIKTSLITTYSGGFILLFSIIAWYFLSKKNKSYWKNHLIRKFIFSAANCESRNLFIHYLIFSIYNSTL